MARSRKRLSYKKELYYIICIVVLLVVLGFSIFGPGGYRDLQKARLDLQEQRVRVEELKRKNYERMKSIEELRSSRDALEKYAREKVMGKRGKSFSSSLQIPMPNPQSRKATEIIRSPRISNLESRIVYRLQTTFPFTIVMTGPPRSFSRRMAYSGCGTETPKNALRV